MKKIGILTASRTNNFGTDLQAYAMQQIFSRYSDVEIINYVCDQFKSGKQILPGFTLKHLIRLPYNIYKNISHSLYRRKHFIYSKRKYTVKTLEDIGKCYDAIVVGSDQIWNLDITGGDINFFLPWRNVSVEKYSYAASLGKTDVSQWEKKYELSKYMGEFQCVSVREMSAIETLKAINIEAQVDLDPILMVDKEEWSDIPKAGSSRPYLLIYLVGSDIRNCNQAIKYAKENNMDVIRVSALAYPYSKVKTKSFVSLKKWMALVKNAKMIITDSYHGLSFAIVNNVNFRLLLMDDKEKNTRSVCLLNKMDLDMFLLDNSYDIELCPDWNKVEERIQVERTRSLRYIKEICDR